MSDLHRHGLPQREGVHQTFQRVAAMAGEIADRAAAYRSYAERLRRLIADQDVAVRV